MEKNKLGCALSKNRLCVASASHHLLWNEFEARKKTNNMRHPLIFCLRPSTARTAPQSRPVRVQRHLAHKSPPTSRLSFTFIHLASFSEIPTINHSSWKRKKKKKKKKSSGAFQRYERVYSALYKTAYGMLTLGKIDDQRRWTAFFFPKRLFSFAVQHTYPRYLRFAGFFYFFLQIKVWTWKRAKAQFHDWESYAM